MTAPEVTVFSSGWRIRLTCPPLIDPARMRRSTEKRDEMGRKRNTAEQIIRKLREAEVELAKGQKIAEVARKLGITEQTYYRWRREYGGLKVSQAKRLKELERENGRLKRAVANLTVDKLILEEAARGNF